MNGTDGVGRTLGAKRSPARFLVLGMHRSGTSAVTGALRLCGAWVGDDGELTGANIENPNGFWERRDVRRICDALLLAAGADWWKIASFDTKAIPYAVLAEERRRLATIVSRLDEQGTWVVKEPRLSLLLPVLHDCITSPVCIHIVRNPLEVARSLQVRNGFGIAAGLALWEAYNLHALRASESLPRVLVSHDSLVLHPAETIRELIRRLDEHVASRLAVPDRRRLEQFIDPSLYRSRASEDETTEHLSPSQRALWREIRDGHLPERDTNDPIPRATRQHLFDLESLKFSRRDAKTKLNAELAERDAEIESRDEVIRSLRDRVDRLGRDLVGRDAAIGTRDEKIRELESKNKRLRVEAERRTATVHRLHNSTSWRVTSPLRSLSRGARWLGKNFRRAMRLLFWLGTGRHARALDAVRRTLSRPGTRPRAVRRNSPPRGGHGSPSGTSRKQPKDTDAPARSRGRTVASRPVVRISVVAWDLGHNALGRAYMLADLLRNRYDVEVIGANFPLFGDAIWEPLRTGSRVAIKRFPGAMFPDHFRTMEEIARSIEGDLIYVSKPKLPALELAILAKLHRNRSVILDIDDFEPGFHGAHGTMTLEEARRCIDTPGFERPGGEIWTRYAQSLIPYFDAITVSNEELRKKFGGMVVPHARDERDFKPGLHSREAMRAKLGFGSGDKVILFAGTPLVHKGIGRIVAALGELGRSSYKLLVVGRLGEGEPGLDRLPPGSMTTVPGVPFSELPRYLVAGDLVCVLQDESSVISRFQTPAKFTDALAMGIPVLASNAPPLVNLANKGLVELLNGSPLAARIEEIFRNYPTYKRTAVENRKAFLSEFSYGANLPRLTELIERLVRNPAPVPAAFHELVAFHRQQFSSGIEFAGGGARVETSRLPRACERPRETPGVRAG